MRNHTVQMPAMLGRIAGMGSRQDATIWPFLHQFLAFI
jgi:hypothetical protein